MAPPRGHLRPDPWTSRPLPPERPPPGDQPPAPPQDRVGRHDAAACLRTRRLSHWPFAARCRRSSSVNGCAAPASVDRSLRVLARTSQRATTSTTAPSKELNVPSALRGAGQGGQSDGPVEHQWDAASTRCAPRHASVMDAQLILEAAAQEHLTMPATEAAFRVNSDELAQNDEVDFSAVLRRMEDAATTYSHAYEEHHHVRAD